MTADLEALAAEAVSNGVTCSFGIPGSGPSLSIIDALERQDIPFYLTSSEGTGALMAATVGRLSGSAGLSLSIKGPGLANAVPGLAAAWFEAFPVVHVAEAFGPDAPLAKAHKRLDQDALTKVVVKARRYHAKSGPGYSELSSFAASEEPGPVLLEVPPSQAQDDKPLPQAESVQGNLGAALGYIARAERPLVIAGALAVRAKVGATLQGLKIPVFSTASAKGIIDEASLNAAGVFTGAGLDLTPETTLLSQCDLVIGIGLTAREVLSVTAFRAPYISLEAVETPGSNSFLPVARVNIGNVDRVLAELGTHAWGLDALRSTMMALQGHLTEGFLPGAVFQMLESRFLRTARIVLDTGHFCTIGEHQLNVAHPDLCLLAGQSRYMGTCLPMALGAAIYDPITPVIAILGDGSIGMSLTDVKLAVRHRLPLLVVLMTDGSFSSVRTQAKVKALTEFPLYTDQQDWVPIFEAFGIPGSNAYNHAAVEDALAKWEPANGPAFLQVSFDPDAYEAMVTGIR